MALVNGAHWVTSAEIRMPRVGAFHFDGETDDEETLSGPITLIEEGITFVGTVIRSKPFGGRTRFRAVGGKGGLSKVLPARAYATGVIKISLVLADILRECGETLSQTSDQEILGTQLPKWHREAGAASHALVQLLDDVGASWRVLRDGTIWVGKDSYPELSVTHTLIDEDWCTGVTTIAPDAPDLTPGTTFLGQKIDLVVHRVDQTLRTEAHLISPGATLNRILGHIRRKIDYSRLYRARVSLQNSDGSLQLVPDDEKVKGGGLDKVPLRHGLPGLKVLLKPGARVMLGWDGGDPSDPFAALCDESTPFVSIAFEGTGGGIARIGDSVQVFFPPSCPIVGTITPPGSAFAGVVTFVTPGFGIIETGNPKVTA